jgi:hypothetical protein
MYRKQSDVHGIPDARKFPQCCYTNPGETRYAVSVPCPGVPEKGPLLPYGSLHGFRGTGNKLVDHEIRPEPVKDLPARGVREGAVLIDLPVVIRECPGSFLVGHPGKGRGRGEGMPALTRGTAMQVDCTDPLPRCSREPVDYTDYITDSLVLIRRIQGIHQVAGI